MSNNQETQEIQETPQENKKRKLKMNGEIKDGKFFVSVVDGKEGEMVFDPKEVHPDIKKQLPVIALNHLLRDATGDSRGTECEEKILAKWESLKNGEYSIRNKTAKPKKIDPNEIFEKLKTLNKADRKANYESLKMLGVTFTDDQLKELGLS